MKCNHKINYYSIEHAETGEDGINVHGGCIKCNMVFCHTLCPSDMDWEPRECYSCDRPALIGPRDIRSYCQTCIDED